MLPLKALCIGAAAILEPYQDEQIVRESAQERDEEDVDIDSGIEIWEKNSIKRMVCKDFDLYYSVMFLQHTQATVTV